MNRVRLAERPAPTLSPEREKLGQAILKRDELAKRVAALEAAADSAKNDQYDAERDLEKWNEYLPSATEAEVRNRVNEAIGKPATKPAKTSAEARQAISNLEDTITSLKSTRDAVSKELERTSRDFRIADGEVQVCIYALIESAPEVERLMNDLNVAKKVYETLIEASCCFAIPRRLQHLANPIDGYNRDQTLRKQWEAAFAALRNDASAPFPS